MAFVDITGTVDADTDGIVFEGKPGLERPIIPRFVVPRSLARKLANLTTGDAEQIEKQRRSGNTNIQFDETKLRELISGLGGQESSVQRIDQETARSSLRSSRSFYEDDYYSSDRDEPPAFDEPEQFDAMWTPEDDDLRDLDRRLGQQVPPSPPPVIGEKYEVVQSEDGVYYAKDISARDVAWMRSGESKPPKLPFFAPLGGGNDQDTGEGYFFSVDGKRYWGKYGAAGALVRRRNQDGEYEYFLARRASRLSTGGGKWAFPGGAHKDRTDAKSPGVTAIDEFREEVGGDISSLQQVSTYKDQVAPDWAYETYVYEANQGDLSDLKIETGETSEIGWFTASEIMDMGKRGELHDSFRRSAKNIFKLSGDRARARKIGPTRKSTKGDSKRSTRLSRGDGMIKRDERGRPVEWDTDKFINEQAEKRTNWLRSLGFSDEEIKILTGVEPSKAPLSSRSSRARSLRLEAFDLFSQPVKPRPDTRPFDGLDKWSDDELINILDVANVELPRKYQTHGITVIPDWLPTDEQVMIELERRGYSIFLTPGTSRRHQDFVYFVSPNADADDTFTDRRIAQPSGELAKLIREKQRSSDKPILAASIKDWDFIKLLSNLDDEQLAALSLDFDRQRTEKVKLRRDGVVSDAEFESWYKELTRLRRLASDEMTKRSLRKMVDKRKKLTPQNDETMTASDYAFIKQGMPSLKSKRSFGLVVDSMIDDGRVNDGTFSQLAKYHDIKDDQLNQLSDAFSSALNVDIFDPSFSFSDINPADKEVARDIFNKYDIELSKQLSGLDLNEFSSDELESLGIEPDDIDDILEGQIVPSRLTSRSRRGKKDKTNKPAMRPSKKLSPEELRISQEQKLRAKKIPGKRRSGPNISEWRESRAIGHTSQASVRARNIAMLNDVALGKDPRLVGKVTEIDGKIRRVGFGSDIKLGDVLPDNFNDRIQAHGDPRFRVMSVLSSGKDSRSLMLQDLRTGSFVGSTLHDQQIIADALRPSGSARSSRSSRVGIPFVRNKVIRLFEQNDDDGIVEYFENLLDEYQDISDQISLLDKQAGPDGLSDEDDRRWTQLEEMLSGIEKEISEVSAAISYLGSEANNYASTQRAIKRALSAAARYKERGMERNDLSEDDWQKIINLIKEQNSELKKGSFVRNNSRIKSIADRIDRKILDSKSFVDVIEFDEDDETDPDIISQDQSASEQILDYAISSVMRSNEINNANNTVINTTAREVSSSSILELPAGPTASRSKRINVPIIENGRGVPVSRRLHPSRNSKFDSSEYASIVFDGNRGEIVARKKNGDITRYGGITEDTLANFLDNKVGVVGAFNGLDKSSSYVVRPAGDIRGIRKTSADLLLRDMSRFDIQPEEKKIVQALIDGYRDGKTENLTNISAEQLHGFINKLHSDGEHSFANNVLNASDEVRSMRSGRAEVGAMYSKTQKTPSKPVKLVLSADEVAELREEANNLQKIYGFNPKIKEGLNVFSNALSKAQNDSDIQEINLLPEEVELITSSYRSLMEMPNSGDQKIIGLQPIELAALSARGLFDSAESGMPPLSRKMGPFNNSAPLSFSRDRVGELENWVSTNNNNPLIEYMSKQKPTLNWWRSIDALREFWPTLQQRTVNSNQELGKDSIQGVSLASMKPKGYDQMPPIDRLVWLNENIASPNNKKGINRVEAKKEATNIMQFLDIVASNLSRNNEYRNFSEAVETIDGSLALPMHQANWPSLSRRSKDMLNDDANKLYGQDFLDLNPAQSSNVLRRLQQSSVGRGSSMSSIDDVDLDLLAGSNIAAFNEFTSAIRRRKRSGQGRSNFELPKPSKQPVARSKRPMGASRRGINISSAAQRAGETPEPRTSRAANRIPRSLIESENMRTSDSNRFARAINFYAELLNDSYADRYGDRNMVDSFNQIRDIFASYDSSGQASPKKFSLGDLDIAIDLADDILSSQQANDITNGRWDSIGKRLTPSAQNSLLDAVGQLRGLRKEMASLRDRYESDPFIPQAPSRPIRPNITIPEPRSARREGPRLVEPINAIENYFKARQITPGLSARSSRSSSDSGKEGRAEIRAEATKFKELLDSLNVEISKADDPVAARALSILRDIMKRQKSGLISDKRTNAGALFLTQTELDDIIEALYMAMDRQLERGSENRSRLFGEFAELMARAAMATFIDKTVAPINSRTVKKINEAGKEVDVLLYE